MAFEVHKQGKLCDQLEAQAYDWVMHDIEEQYGVESFSDLGVEQVNEIEEYLEDEDQWKEDYVSMTLRSLIDMHDSRQEDLQ